LLRGITISIVNLLLIILITSVFASHNPSAISQDMASKNASASAIANVSEVHTRLAIINFDDGYKSHFINAKPILDMYGFKASFFIVCNFVGKSAKQMNSSSIINFAGKGVEQMTWNDITTLYKQGYQIGAHSMDHLRNMTNMPNSELDYEIGRSKKCIRDHDNYIRISI
jgi:peptidoglycan/xylan/chitin deacetylase (PgdA/CDA1 family)